MSSSTATVETLTAEVRVLMVGNRQVTLSVARQLDWCNLTKMEPFGRINIGDDNVVIGRHSESGALVRARYLKYQPTPLINADDLLAGPITICRRFRSQGKGYSLRFDERQIHVEEAAAKECEHKEHSWGGRCEYGWLPNGNEIPIRVAIRRADEVFQLHRRAATLPLIVLAGLR